MTEITQTDLDDELTVVYLLGCKDGADKERAAIIAWLRDEDDRLTNGGILTDADYLASAIEAGEHLKCTVSQEA